MSDSYCHKGRIAVLVFWWRLVLCTIIWEEPVNYYKRCSSLIWLVLISQEKIETWSVSVFDSAVAFLGVITLNTFEDFKNAISFLFSGIYDSKNIMISYSDSFTKREIMRLLEESLQPVKNRYGEIADVNLSIETICHHSRISVLYPYGGTDFGSLMLFILSKLKRIKHQAWPLMGYKFNKVGYSL